MTNLKLYEGKYYLASEVDKAAISNVNKIAKLQAKLSPLTIKMNMLQGMVIIRAIENQPEFTQKHWLKNVSDILELSETEILKRIILNYLEIFELAGEKITLNKLNQGEIEFLILMLLEDKDLENVGVEEIRKIFKSLIEKA